MGRDVIPEIGAKASRLDWNAKIAQVISHRLISVMDTPQRVDDDTKDEKNDVQQIEVLDADLDVKGYDQGHRWSDWRRW